MKWDFVIGRVISPFIRDKFGCESDRAMDDQITSASAGFVHPASSAGSELDWMEPSACLSNNSKMLQSYGSERVYDAFHLLQTESSVQVPFFVDHFIFTRTSLLFIYFFLNFILNLFRPLTLLKKKKLIICKLFQKRCSFF